MQGGIFQSTRRIIIELINIHYLHNNTRLNSDRVLVDYGHNLLITESLISNTVVYAIVYLFYYFLDRVLNKSCPSKL